MPLSWMLFYGAVPVKRSKAWSSEQTAGVFYGMSDFCRKQNFLQLFVDYLPQ